MNPIQERMRCIRKIQLSILGTLYANEEKALTKAMWLIGEENQTLLRANSPTFVYDGRWWPIPKPPDPLLCNKTLHHSLYGQVHELLSNSCFKDIEMKSGIEAVVSNFLSAAGHIEDLHRLFPEILRMAIPSVDHFVFNITEPLSDTEIQIIVDKNKGNLKYFKRLLMTRILLART